MSRGTPFSTAICSNSLTPFRGNSSCGRDNVARSCVGLLLELFPLNFSIEREKPFVARAPRVALCRNRDLLEEMQENLVSSAIELIDTKIFCETLEKVWSGREVPIVTLMRTIAIEMWLRGLVHSGLLLSGQTNKYKRSLLGKDSPAAFRTSLS